MKEQDRHNLFSELIAKHHRQLYAYIFAIVIQAVGVIAGGAYEMQTGNRKGASPGKYIVTVHCRQKPDAKQTRDMHSIPESLIPQKYSKDAQSPLRFEVKSRGNEFPITLE